MNDKELKALHNKILELVAYFDAFCKTHNISYYLMGGTALGAVRHEGFIPWDDDFDVFMERDQYLRFCQLAREDLNVKDFYFQEENTEEWPLHFSKIRMNNTTFIEKDVRDKNIHHGIYLDVMCLYGTSEYKLIRYVQYLAARVLNAKALSLKGYVTLSKGKRLAMLSAPFVVFAPVKSFLFKIVNWYQDKEKSMLAHFFSRGPFSTVYFKREYIGAKRYQKFENLSLPVFDDVESLLEVSFGKDYMEIPSLEVRNKYASHAYIVDVNKSYTHYLNNILNWRKYNGAILPLTPPDVEVTESEEVIRKYLKSFNAYFARWTANFDSEQKTAFWYVIQDKAMELTDYDSKTRNKIKKGLNNCLVRKIDKKEFLKNAYPVYIAAHLGYKNRPKFLSENDFIKAANILSGEREFWGVYSLDGQMIGYAQNQIIDDYCNYDEFRLHPDYLKLRPSEVLIYTMNKQYLNERNFAYVNNGTRSIAHDTNVQHFLIRKFQFRKAYCTLHIVYSPFLGFVVACLFPFRKFVKTFNLKPLRSFLILMNQEEMRRSFV